MDAAFSRIDASRAMEQSLRSGDLGEELRDRLSQLMLATMRAGINFKKILQARRARSGSLTKREIRG